jgi:hypothetical protein
MAAVATLGSYRKNSFKIYIAASLLVAMLCVWDGYLSKGFIEKHSPDGKPDSTLAANKVGPFVLVPIAIILAGRWWMVKDRKIVADGKNLILDDGRKIAYDSIEKIDKSKFEKSGYFVITYKDESGTEATQKLSDRHFDKLEDVLAELVAALKGGPA